MQFTEATWLHFINSIVSIKAQGEDLRMANGVFQRQGIRLAFIIISGRAEHR